MHVRFIKSGERQYSVAVLDDRGREVAMAKAPGYDDRMPHDLQHFIVEKHFGLRGGIFGQIAAGGGAGTFHDRDTTGSKRDRARRRRAAKKKDTVLMKAGRDDAARSERATIICLRRWLAQADDKKMHNRDIGDIREWADTSLSLLPDEERAEYTEARMVGIIDEMNEVSRRWQRTEVGDYMELAWTL